MPLVHDQECSQPGQKQTQVERLARRVAKHFGDAEYTLLDTIREEVELKSGASKVVTLLSAMLKALVSRRVKITPEELQVTDA